MVDLALLNEKRQHLQQHLCELDSTIVAYSGGVDSSLLAFYARQQLGKRAWIVIALSASLAGEELAAARAQAQQFAWDLIEIETCELDNEAYTRNDERRCYFCKRTLFTELEEMARRLQIKHIAYGANVDDLADYRPGHQAAHEFHVVSPLQEAKLHKDEIRWLARDAGLPSWDRPQAACLASRLPTFEKVTIDALSTIDQSEEYLHSLGFKQVRVRHYGQQARVEVAFDELPRLLADAQLKENVIAKLQAIGYSEVVIDPQGYRRGSANTFLNAEAVK